MKTGKVCKSDAFWKKDAVCGIVTPCENEIGGGILGTSDGKNSFKV